MADVSPELLARAQMAFNGAFYEDKIIRNILPKIYAEKATYTDLYKLAQRAGELCSESLNNVLTANALPEGMLYYNIAENVVGNTLRALHVQIDDLAQQVQTGLNKKARIGLKAQSVPVDSDRINGIVNAASHTATLERAHKVIDGSTINYTQHVVDEAVRLNADFQYGAGLDPKVTRKTDGKCCEWCSDLAGTYYYEEVNYTGCEVWRRHTDCKCLIEYDPGDGKREKVNNYRRRTRTGTSPAELLERRKLVGLPDDRKGKR